tara:strand:- start:161 stop:322 length:162 start_codon:yes stop_codon:yes gene_type:complete
VWFGIRKSNESPHPTFGHLLPKEKERKPLPREKEIEPLSQEKDLVPQLKHKPS